MAADVKDENAPDAPADESLPTEIKKEPKKKTMLLAVIVAVVVVIAAVAAAITLLGGGEDEEPANVLPSGGARALTGTTIDIGGSVTFESLAADSDGEIVNYTWYYGDGESDKGTDLNKTTHTFDYGGNLLVYHEVEDDAGGLGDNEAQMIGVTVIPYAPDANDLQNDTAPFAYMTSDDNVIEANTTVMFNMSGCAATGWSEDDWAVGMSWEYIDSVEIDFGDGSAAEAVDVDEFMTAEHEYTASGHYAAKVTVTSGAAVETTYILTIHVLSPEGTYTGTIKNPDAFIMVSIGEPDFLDPAVDYETAGGEISMNCYETLIWYDEESTVDMVPVLASEIPSVENDGISEDGMNYTFKIREGVTFHDGTDLTADDVAYSIQRILRMHDPNGPSWMLEQITTNYLSFYIGEELQTYIDDCAPPQWVLDAIGETSPTYVLTEDDNQEVAEASITIVDDMTVNFRLTKPFPAFLKICAYTMMSIVSQDYVEENGGIVNGEHNEVMDETVCGTGPYMLLDGGWEYGTKIHLVENPDYWGDQPALSNVYLVTATDENTRILMLQAGDADCIALSIDKESLFAGDPDYDITKGLPTFDMTFAGFNMNIDSVEAATYGSDVPSDFFTDKHIRFAFVSMLDYATFIQNVLKGNAIQSNGPIPKGMFGYNEDIPYYEYDLDVAKEHLQLAINPDTGNSWWEDGFSVALFYNAGNTYRETACNYLKAALEDLTVLAESDTGATFAGVVNALDWPTYLSVLRATPSPFPMFYLGWAPDYADPDDYVTPFLDSVYGTYTHNTGYANASIDALARAAAVELDNDVRQQMYTDLLWLVYDDCPYFWLWQGNNFHIERSWVNGYYFNPMYAGFYYPAFSKG